MHNNLVNYALIAVIIPDVCERIISYLFNSKHTANAKQKPN